MRVIGFMRKPTRQLLVQVRPLELLKGAARPDEPDKYGSLDEPKGIRTQGTRAFSGSHENAQRATATPEGSVS